MLDTIATYLDAQSTDLKLLQGSSGNLVKTYWPEGSPNELIGLFETPGSLSYFEFSTGSSPERVYINPSLQVLSRSTSVVTAKENMHIVFDLLDGFTGAMSTSTGTPHFVQIIADQAPFQADRDANQRFVYSVNFTVWRTT